MASRAEEKERAREARLAAEADQERAAKRRTAVLRLGLVLGLAVVVVIIAVLVSSGGGGSSSTSSSSGGGSGTSASDAKAANALFAGIPQHGVTLGAATAKPTLIEFADLQCPYCAEYSRQAMSTVVKDFVRTGKVRYELRLRSFLGKDSVTAAGAAAEATRENKLYPFADLFYSRQGEENTGYVNDGFISGVAKGVGVDPSKAVAASHNANKEPLVAAAESKAQSLGSNSTPDFFLRLPSGRLVKVSPSDLTGPAMTKAIDAALAQT
jgi:protein-disulfide isomerase